MVGRSERRHSGRVLILSLAIGAIAALPGHALGASATDSETLTRAQVIGAEVDARYRNLAVTEVTTTGVVESLTLVEGGLEPLRVVPAANGIYFALCAARARCPYPVRSAVWRMGAALPRRVAVELALRTFLETSATLVVVALPTAEPVWLLFERDDFLRAASASQPLDRFDDPLVDLLTRARLYLPLPILPPPKDTLFALRVSMP